MLRQRIESFLEQEERINELVPLNEEIDFEGLAQYIKTDLFDDVQKYLRANWRERENAKGTIVSKVVAYAQANSSMSCSRAVTLTEKVMAMLYHYYKSKISIVESNSLLSIDRSVQLMQMGRIDQVERKWKSASFHEIRDIVDTFSNYRPDS